jgi:hypothetical protein
MSRLLRSALVVVATTAAVSASGGDPMPSRGPLSVFVQARADEAERSAAEQSTLKERSDAASESFQNLEKDLRKQFGKDATKWPEDRRRAYYEAMDALGVAWSESYYYARPAKEKADSIRDTGKYLSKDRKNSYVTLAPSREEADLLMEIMGRRGQAKFIAGSKYLGFDILPGKISTEALLTLSREQFKPGFDTHVITLHWPKPGEPYFRFETNDTERWQDVAEYAVMTVAELAKTYYETLKPAK